MIWSFNLLKGLKQAVFHINHPELLLHRDFSRLKNRTTLHPTKDILYSTDVANCLIVAEAPWAFFDPQRALSYMLLSHYLIQITHYEAQCLYRKFTASRPGKFYWKSATLCFVQMSSCLMKVPGVIMTLCCYENKCVLWWRLREHKGNKLNNQKCTGWEFVLLTKQHYGESLQKGTMWSCSTWQLHTDTGGGLYVILLALSLSPSLILYPSHSPDTGHRCSRPLSDAACLTNPQLCFTFSRPPPPSSRVFSVSYQ